GAPRTLAVAGPVDVGPEGASATLEPAPGAEESTSPTEAAAGGRLQLALGDLEGHGGANLAVYLGEPDGDPAHPSDRMIGTLSTFGLAHVEHAGHEGHHHGRAAHFYDITDVVQRLEAQGERVDQLRVTFVPIDLLPPPEEAGAEAEAAAGDPEASEGEQLPAEELTVRVGRIELFVE
ncbi:MAG TPA: hypothetical protein VGW10_18560, partial [Solirubrobacteraceae bacterium]|nr:hypothetical protein [Solirubrobacteraceae bacterium]